MARASPLGLSHRRIIILSVFAIISFLLMFALHLSQQLSRPPLPPPLLPHPAPRLRPPDELQFALPDHLCGPEVEVNRHLRVPRSVEEIRAVIGRTNGLLVRDWSLWLGWNNMKYIVETALYHASLLNRTLVLPSFVYARDCEFEHEVCSTFVQSVNRNESGSTEWEGLGEEEQGWRIPISIMLDLPYLLSARPTILTSELLLLSSLPASAEPSDGQFSPSLLSPSTTVYTLSAEAYDPPSILRVDRMPPPLPEGFGEEVLRELRGRDKAEKDVKKLFDARKDVAFSTLRSRLRKVGVPSTSIADDAELIKVGKALGLEPLYQYEGRKLDMTRSVAVPYKAFAPRSLLRGFIDDFSPLTSEVLYIRGELHAGRRPGSMWFSSVEGRDGYTKLVLGIGGLRVPWEVGIVAERVAMRMGERCGGRMWMAAHMRRGDFERLSWALNASFLKHLIRIQHALAGGREVLRQRQMERWQKVMVSASVPGVKPYQAWGERGMPLQDDPFYLATDTRNATQLELLHDSPALLLSDLLTPADRRLLGSAACLTDYLGLIEKEVMIRSAYWVGHAQSSLGGAVANGRAGWGMDVRTTVLEL